MVNGAATESDLRSAIAQARALAPKPVWTSLLGLAGIPAEELRHALLKLEGIAILDDAALSRAASVATAERAFQSDPRSAWVECDGATYFVSDDPWAPASLIAMSRRPGCVPTLALPQQLESLSARQEGKAMAAGPAALGAMPNSIPDPSRGTVSAVSFVDKAIATAHADHASDIHFESDRHGMTVKFRIDGVMSPGDRLEQAARAEEVISRIKVLAQLDITERRRPQDGRIQWERSGQELLDLRVSIMPSIFGEDAVLRLLDKSQLRQAGKSISLASLGFDSATALQLRALAAKPHGMLLVTGPTGSGKTTTVYAALSEVNTGLEKIVTIEDPVEYELPGVLQIPVNEQKGLTFATGLRSILRHDPDKILVGEIRDAETAEIAVQSSLTGHLVMTTVHANSLYDVLGRFQHFGIDPFGLASALNGVVVQRLLRRTCDQCLQWREVDDATGALFSSSGLDVPERVPRACGCTQCRGTGYKGRLVVAEVHTLNDFHRDLMIRRATLLELKQSLSGHGATTLMGRALAQVALGTTTLEEIERVVGTV